MNVYLFGFAKKNNSTKQPSISNGTLYPMQLKEQTNVTSPILITNKRNQFDQPEQPTLYNYAYIPIYQRYYFINDWRYINGAWECYCSVDVLASFKAQIGAMTAYVERSASMYDSNVVDGLYPVKADSSVTVQDLGQIFNINTGCYIVGVIDCQITTDRKGAVTYWAMKESELNSLLQFLYSGAIYNMSNITEISEGLYKSIQNPAQYIVSCMWCPFAQSTIASGNLTNITIGYWTTNVAGKVMNAITLTGQSRVLLPNHPQVSRGAYLNFAPFSRYTLFFPPFGTIPIESIYRSQGSYLAIDYSMDLVSGQGSLRLSMQAQNELLPKGSRKYFAERSAMVGVPIQLSQVNTDYFSGVTGLLNSAISAISGNYAGAASGILSSAGDMMTSRAQSTGYNGSFLETDNSHVLVSEFYTQTDIDYVDHGKPLMTSVKLNTLSGYIKCSDGHFEGLCYDSERNLINGYLTGGFYYE